MTIDQIELFSRIAKCEGMVEAGLHVINPELEEHDISGFLTKLQDELAAMREAVARMGRPE